MRKAAARHKLKLAAIAFVSDHGADRSQLIGWWRDDRVFLEPDAAYRAAATYLRQQGRPWTASKEVLGASLVADLGARHDAGKTTTKVTIAGRRLRVWDLPLDAIVEIAQAKNQRAASGRPSAVFARVARAMIVTSLARLDPAEAPDQEHVIEHDHSDHLPREKVVDLRLTTSLSVARVLDALTRTGFFGNGRDSSSVAEELLRRALLQPDIAVHWRKS